MCSRLSVDHGSFRLLLSAQHRISSCPRERDRTDYQLGYFHLSLCQRGGELLDDGNGGLQHQ